MKILLTGATGFLGRVLTRHLVEGGVEGGVEGSAGGERHDVALLARPTSDRRGFPEGVEWVTGDVTDRASLVAAFRGRDAVVHAAALVKILAPADDFDRVNVAGLDHVLAAAEEAGVERLLYVSSFMAFGPTENLPGGTADETTPPADRDWINHYERTKTLADRRARRAIAEGVPLSVVYPGVIYGPGALTEGNILVRHLLDLAAKKLPGLLGSPERVWNYVFVEDVARGIASTLERAAPGEPGWRYVLGGENVRQGDLYDHVREVGGIRVPRRRIPDWLATGTGFAARELARLTGGTPALTPDLVEIYRHDWALDSTRAADELGWRGRRFRDGLEETVNWLREIGRWPKS